MRGLLIYNEEINSLSLNWPSKSLIIFSFLVIININKYTIKLDNQVST